MVTYRTIVIMVVIESLILLLVHSVIERVGVLVADGHMEIEDVGV